MQNAYLTNFGNLTVIYTGKFFIIFKFLKNLNLFFIAGEKDEESKIDHKE